MENIPENEYSTYFRDLILNYDPENTIERMSIKLGAVLLIEDLEILDELRNHDKIDELPKKEKIRENIEFKINRLHDRESRRS